MLPFLFYHKFIKTSLVIHFSTKQQHITVSNNNLSSGENCHVPHNMAAYDMSIFIWEWSMKMSTSSKCSNKWDNLMPSFDFNNLLKNIYFKIMWKC